MRLRVGVLGVGAAWETRHRPALRALADRFEVRAMCDAVQARAELAAREFRAGVCCGFRALVMRDDIDAVLMLDSAWMGALPILAACDHGKAIYCATALEIAAETAQAVKQRVAASGVAFMAEFPRRHAPATLRLKELIATRLGPPRLLFCHSRLRGEQLPPVGCQRVAVNWRELTEQIDWCRYVMGAEPVEVFGARHLSGGQLDYEMVSLDFSTPERRGEGALANISFGSYIPPQWSEAVGFRAPAAMQVMCQRGVAFVDPPSTLVWFDEAGRHHESLDSERPVGEQLLTQFHRAVTSLVRKTSDLEDAYRAIHVLQLARVSATAGHRQPI